MLAQQSLIFAGVPVDPVLRFEYDALYRLVAAEGRELAGADAQPAAIDILRSAVPSATAARRYRETYAYDPGGNITSMRHEGGAGWERRYAYAAGSNRISGTSLPGDPAAGPFSATYAHDARGNVTAMPHLASLAWDAKDRLTTVDLGGGGTVHYTYDSAGRRVRKVIQRVGSIVEETVYLAGWERFRRRNGAGLVAERETLHVSDGGQRIAIVETETRDAGGPIANPAPLIRYQLHNRLGSSTLEIDDSGAVLSYEEYHPYGGTAYAAGAAKRYRFGGHERDDETGLYYCNARYYAPWLGRWVSADPAGLADGTNLYAYARGNPATYADPTGTESRDEELPSQAYDALKLIGVGSSNPSEGGGRSIGPDRERARLTLGCRVQRGQRGMELAGRRRSDRLGLDQGRGQQGMELDQGRRRVCLELDQGRGIVGLGVDEGRGVERMELDPRRGEQGLDLGDRRRQHGLELDQARGRCRLELDEGRSQHSLGVDQGCRRDRGSCAQGRRRVDLELDHRARHPRRLQRARPRRPGLPHRRPGRGGDPGRGGAGHRCRPRLVDGVCRELRLEQAVELADVPRRQHLEPAELRGGGAVLDAQHMERDRHGPQAAGEGPALLQDPVVLAVRHDLRQRDRRARGAGHKSVHGLQARLFGPLFYPLVIAGYGASIALPYWVFYHDFKKFPIKNVGNYFERGAYGHHWIEEWAYDADPASGRN